MRVLQNEEPTKSHKIFGNNWLWQKSNGFEQDLETRHNYQEHSSFSQLTLNSLRCLFGKQQLEPYSRNSHKSSSHNMKKTKTRGFGVLFPRFPHLSILQSGHISPQKKKSKGPHKDQNACGANTSFRKQRIFFGSFHDNSQNRSQFWDTNNLAVWVAT